MICINKEIPDFPLVNSRKKKVVYNNFIEAEGFTPLKRLTVSFILNWLYWLIAWLIVERFLFDEKHSWKYHIFHATWMSFFMTIPFNWNELKDIFKPQKKKDDGGSITKMDYIR